MCGIAGIYNYQNRKSVDPDILKNMCTIIQHRGPDDEGIYISKDNRLGLAHRRLSIIDLKTGQQPMSNVDGSIWIVFNGEIYNYQGLKKELQGKGLKFRTNSDTEVIIAMYQAYGPEGFERLNGIFTFAIYDTRKKCLFLSRDHLGVKPLYYYSQNGQIMFGSEIKCILQNTDVRKELDYEAFNSFFTFRYNPSPQTMFKNIHKLASGHYLQVELGGEIKLKSYWHYSPIVNVNISEKDAVNEYQRLLEQAVKRQMISDVPVGLFLSGGIDSAIIGHLMQRNSIGKIKTFTVGFTGTGDFNELEFARQSAKSIGSDHYDIEIDRNEYLDFFSRSFYFTEEPIAEMTISALYYVAQLAAKQLKVVLSGQGADESLAGYYRYIGESYISKYYKILRMLPLEQVVKFFPRNERLKRAAYAAQFENELDRFLAIYTIFTPDQKSKLFNEDLKRQIINSDKKLVNRLYSECTELKDSLGKILYIDTRMTLSDNLLLFNDKITMANSLEMRVPFLDIDLIRFVESLPSHLKLRGKVKKYIQKKAASKWLTSEVIYRKKREFLTPMDQWLQSNLATTVRDILNDKDSISRRYFNNEYINNMILAHQTKKENYQKQIFAILSFELWYKSFFEGFGIKNLQR